MYGTTLGMYFSSLAKNATWESIINNSSLFMITRALEQLTVNSFYHFFTASFRALINVLTHFRIEVNNKNKFAEQLNLRSYLP